MTIKRRKIIKGIAAAGVASSVYSLMPSTALGANEKVRVGIIGCGGKGGGHINQFNGIPDVDVVAVSDPDLKRMDQKIKKIKKIKNPVAKHQDFRKLLEMKDVDAIVIATPNHWHAMMATMGCMAGKDVYVEKPVSHNIWEGRQMVEAAKKYNRIVQAGTQHRTDPGVVNAAKDIAAGTLGKVLWVHSMHLSVRKTIGKVSKPTDVPDYVDYDLWCGPAAKDPVMRKSFHYDWHWIWNYGNGEIGNWGPHRTDDIRHLCGWDSVPDNVITVGGRYAWNDDGQTPNMSFSVMQYGDVPVVLDIRNLPSKSGSKSAASFKRGRSTNLVMCENGYYMVGRGGGKSFDKDGKTIQKFKGDGGSGHARNFVTAVRNGKTSDLNAPIIDGHYGAVMCHLSNVSYRLGKQASVDEIKQNMIEHEDVHDTIKSIVSQLGDNGVDLKKDALMMGPKLSFDPKTEKFTGVMAKKANELANGSYRKGFEFPSIS